MKRVLLIAILIAGAAGLYAQSDDDQIITAVEFFQTISKRYEEIEDYEAVVEMTHKMNDETLSMKGQMFFKSPDKLLITFTDPAEQVISVNGSNLIIYLPQKSVTLTQNLTRGGESASGLGLFTRGYTFAWVTNYELVPLEEGSPEKVYKLKLGWRTTDEGFREIEMSIGRNKLIRRLVGITKNYDELTLDFKNIRVNQNIPDARFEYETPPNSYEINNFIYAED